MVVTSKADGTPRRTVDLQPQNRHSVRQTHHVPSPFHLADRVPQGMKKTVTDAWNGYHSVPIREEDRHFTTFITPWGALQACEWLDLCARNGITLNPKKFQFAQDTVNFAGLTITLTNIRPSTKFLDAISNFPTPTDITGARAWFGLINQGAYAFAMARQMKPFRALLNHHTTFCWTNELDEVFHKSKRDHYSGDEGRCSSF
ncbi:Hypothetical predicted protein [Mytilus galloprovincialis]|uniref:Reverse transcriptase domain-containing protein n=1 Tax=Mytilus galloprovincialis TaxID=29158 RepID=A0A8B6HTY2_MYTGA|nr:Hypothetical predicted protein [Mytilus galloprovincialis]